MRTGIVGAARVPWTVAESRMEETLGEIDRRSAFLLGLATAGTALAPSDPAEAQTYRPDEGREIGPGVRVVNVSERDPMHGRDSVLPAYKRVVVRDVVFQPGAKDKNEAMSSDMVCVCTEGEMLMDHRNGHPFKVKKNDVWTCVKGQPEDTENIGSTAAIMRVIALLA